MSVEQLNVIDIVAIDPKTDDVALVITDHLEWTPDFEMEHIYLLQEKINLYMDAIETGDIYESYPKAVGRKFYIKVMMMFPMSEAGKRFEKWLIAFVRDLDPKLGLHKIEFEHRR